MADNEDDDGMKEIIDYADRHDRLFRISDRPRSLLTRGSKAVAVKYQDGDGEWRVKIKMAQKTFGDEEKEIFLQEYRKWGRMGEAAAAAGVSTGCVRRHLDKDVEFGEAMLVCEEEYKDKLIGHHQDLVFNGQEKIQYDRNGNIMSRETIYPIRLIELELKKHDEGYRDKQELKVQHTGGVVIAPAETISIDDWEKRFSAAKNITPEDEIEDSNLTLIGLDDEDK